MIQGAKGIIDACSPQFPLKTITSLDIYHFFLNKVHSFSLNWTYASNFYNLIQLNVYFKNIFLHIFLICPIFLFFVDITLFLFAYVHLLRDASIRCAGCLMQNRHERYEARHSLRGLSHTKLTRKIRDASFAARAVAP